MSDAEFWDMHFREFHALMERWQDRERRADLRTAYIMSAFGAKDADKCFPSLQAQPAAADSDQLTEARTRDWLKFMFARAKKPE